MKLRFTCILLSAFLLFSGLAAAQVQPAGADVALFQSQGGKLVYGGREGKLDIWIAMSAQNKPITVLYAQNGRVVRGTLPQPRKGYGYGNPLHVSNGWAQAGAILFVIILRMFFGYRRRSVAGMVLGGLLGGSRRRW